MENKFETNETIKLTCNDVKFMVEPKNKTIIAKVIVTSELLDGEYEFTGIARLHGSDKYDQKFGERLARARAEKEAYIFYKALLKNIKTAYQKDMVVIDNTLNKVVSYIDHQKEYISSLKY